MKKYLMMSMAAVALAGTFTSCSKDTELYDPEAAQNQVVFNYQQAFIKVFGQPASNHDWGFGDALTRAAVAPWATTHAKPHAWESGFDFAKTIKSEDDLPDGAVDLTDSKLDQNLWVDGICYVPSTHTQGGTLKCRITGGAKVYNFGKIDDLDLDVHANADNSQAATFYNVGTITNFAPNAGGDHTIYNVGTMTVTKTSNISELYNNGDLDFDKEYNPYYNDPNPTVDLHSKMTIYSTGNGSVNVLVKADWKAACHIDQTVNFFGSVQFQTPTTDKYICGIVSANKDVVDQNGDHIRIDSDITTSYIKTYNLCLSGDNIFLTKEGYVSADKITFEGTGRITDGNEYEAIKVEANSIALVEANAFSIPNGGQHFGNGVYTNLEGAANYYDTNDPAVGGTSECGGAWGKTPEKDPTPGTSNEPKGSLRIMAEDLSANDATDFDFNDVVFDVYYGAAGSAYVMVEAAGGTLPLYIWNGEEEIEVHELFDQPTNTMINTNASAHGAAVDGLPAQRIDLTFGVNSAADASKIKIYVVKNEVKYELTAELGKPAAKIAVPAGTPYADERENVNTAFEFDEWVKNPSFKLSNSND